MATEFVMPKLGLTMEEGTISEWLLDDGATVTPGMAVMRVETDKTETDVEASTEGVLHHAAAPGQTFACGEVVGWFLAPGEAPPASAAAPAAAPVAAVSAAAPVVAASAVAVAPAPSAAAMHNGRIFASPHARRLSSERGIPLSTVRGTGPNGRIVSEDLENWTPGAAPVAAAVMAAPIAAGIGAAAVGSGITLATHAARQFADLLGVDLGSVAPDPLVGRVTRDGVAAHVRMLLGQLGPTPAKAAPAAIAGGAAFAAAAALAPALQTPTDVIPLKGMRGTIARRMHQSLTDMAQLSLFMDAEMDAVVADRQQRKAAGSAPSYTDYVIAAVARALREHPGVNSQVTDEGVALLPTVNVGMAVALDQGLIVPVVSNALDHSLASLGAETSRLAAACREGSASLADMEGGTFSVSTLGMYGVDGFTPVINPPNTAIMGVGRLRSEIVVVEDGSLESRTRMTLSLTWDHRAFDGAPAAAFTRTVADLLADPAALDR